MQNLRIAGFATVWVCIFYFTFSKIVRSIQNSENNNSILEYEKAVKEGTIKPTLRDWQNNRFGDKITSLYTSQDYENGGFHKL